MVGNRAYPIHLVGLGLGTLLRRNRGPKRATNAPTTTRVTVRTTGRHRVGAEGLRHCGDFATVQQRINAGRQSRRLSRHRRHEPMRLTAQLVTGIASVTATGIVLVSGWYAVAGAAAVAQMGSRWAHFRHVLPAAHHRMGSKASITATSHGPVGITPDRATAVRTSWRQD